MRFSSNIDLQKLMRLTVLKTFCYLAAQITSFQNIMMILWNNYLLCLKSFLPVHLSRHITEVLIHKWDLEFFKTFFRHTWQLKSFYFAFVVSSKMMRWGNVILNLELYSPTDSRTPFSQLPPTSTKTLALIASYSGKLWANGMLISVALP